MGYTRWVLAAVVVGILATGSLAGAAGINWRSDVKGALAEAGKSDRLVMLDFYDNDCTWCDRMDKETLSNAEVVKAVDDVIPVRVDVEKDSDIAQQHSLRGVPTFVFLEGSGAETGRIEGFVPADDFIQQMGEIVGEQKHVVELRAQVAQKPENNDAKAELARIYLKRGQGDQAAPLIDALAVLPKEKAPKDMAEMLLDTAITYGSAGDNDRALVYLTKVTDGYPGTEEAEWASFFTGLALGLKGDREAAIKQLESVLQTAKNEDVRDRAQALLEHFKEGPAVPTL